MLRYVYAYTIFGRKFYRVGSFERSFFELLNNYFMHLKLTNKKLHTFVIIIILQILYI